MKRIAVFVLALGMAGCNGSPLADGVYWIKSGKVGRLGDGHYAVVAGVAAAYDPATGKTTPLPDPTTSLWGIIAMGVGAMIAGRLVGIAAARIPFLAPVAPYITAVLGGSGFRPGVIASAAGETPKPPA